MCVKILFWFQQLLCHKLERISHIVSKFFNINDFHLNTKMTVFVTGREPDEKCKLALHPVAGGNLASNVLDSSSMSSG